MSGGIGNFTPTPRNLQVGREYGAYAPYNSDWNRRQAMFSRFGSDSLPADPDANRGEHHPQPPFERRGITGTFGLPGVPVHAHSLMEIPSLGNLMVRDIRPSHRQITQGAPPGFMNWQNVHPTQEDDSRLTQNEQTAVLKKLKKEIYNPTRMKLTRRLCLYYRDQAGHVYKEMEKQKENDAKRCAVCLEDFEPKEVVMHTPCNHMFHEDCIVPWLKSHARCPVCRFSIGEKGRENAGNNNINTANAAGDDLFAAGPIRARGEDFILINAVYLM